MPGVHQGLSPYSAATPVPISPQFPSPKSQWPSFSLQRPTASPSHPDPIHLQTQWLCQPPAPSSRSPNSTPSQLPPHPDQDVHSGSWPCSPHPHWLGCARDWCPPSRLRLLLIAACPRPLHSLAEGGGKPGCLFKVAPCAARPSNTMKHMHNYTQAPETLRQPCGHWPGPRPVLLLDQLPLRGPVPRRGSVGRSTYPCTPVPLGRGLKPPNTHPPAFTPVPAPVQFGG